MFRCRVGSEAGPAYSGVDRGYEDDGAGHSLAEGGEEGAGEVHGAEDVGVELAEDGLVAVIRQVIRKK